jgi:PrtD family type I secretion system ABC transporter
MAGKRLGEKEKSAPVREVLVACRHAFLAVAGFSLAINVLMLASPLYMMQVFDRVLSSQSIETLTMLTIVVVGVLAIMAVLEMVRSRVLLKVSLRLEQELSPRALEASVAAALGGRGHSVQALRDVSTVRNFLTGTGIFALFDAPWAPIFIAVTFLLHPGLGLVTFFGALALFGLALLSEMATRKPLAEASTASVLAYRNAEASTRNADAIESMGMMGGLLRRWQNDNLRVLLPQAIASERAGYVVALVKKVRLLLQVLVYAVGAYLVIDHQITAGVMVAASLLMGRALAPVEAAVGTWRSLVSARVAYARLNEVLGSIQQRGVAMALPAPTGRLSVERVVYLPPGAETATLKGVSFDLNPGDALGVVGPSAAGKSTLAKLVVGSWRASAGKVRLDDADVFTWDRADFGRYVGYLPQDVELFSGTIRDNIGRLGDAEPEVIVAAAKMAGIHETILRLPKGYETEIGEGGEVLSAGQRQQVALARALLGQPKLLVLDEPNSNLDTDGEKALMAGLAAARDAGSTIVVIAHRPTVLEVCNKMLVLRNGTVEMFGARDEVMEKIRRPARLEGVSAPQIARVAAKPRDGGSGGAA